MPRPTANVIADATRTWELVECSHERLVIYRSRRHVALNVLVVLVMLEFLLGLLGACGH